MNLSCDVSEWMAFLMSLERMIGKYGQILALVVVEFSRLRHTEVFVESVLAEGNGDLTSKERSGP